MFSQAFPPTCHPKSSKGWRISGEVCSCKKLCIFPRIERLYKKFLILILDVLDFGQYSHTRLSKLKLTIRIRLERRNKVSSKKKNGKKGSRQRKSWRAFAPIISLIGSNSCYPILNNNFRYFQPEASNRTLDCAILYWY